MQYTPRVRVSSTLSSVVREYSSLTPRPETDPESYMRLYGSWVHDKKGGYYQSIDTATVYRGKARGVSGTCDYGRAMTETSHTTDAGSCSKTNVWTIDELETLANEIKREQESAAIIVGA